MAATPALCEALNQGISSGSFVDTKIILYSHRDSSGSVCRPKALYANSHVLKKVPYFEDLLFGNFSESKSKDLKEVVDQQESAIDYGYLSDSDLEDDEDERPSCSHVNKEKVKLFDLFRAPGRDKVSYEKNEEHVGKGKVVKIPDIAFLTFQAFLMYLYTDVIEFAPFGSEESRRSRSAEIVEHSDRKVPRPSPKSIYRLADKYDIPTLKTFALNRIRSELAKCDIIGESFSRFASWYAEIRDLYVSQLAYAWASDSTEVTRIDVEKKIDSFAEGNLEHAAEAISALWKAANQDGDIPALSSAASNPPLVTSPAHWDSVKTALIKSIRTGVFFDREYWAGCSKTRALLKPVYFSSTIMEDKMHQLNKLVKYLNETEISASNLEGDVNIESDCEGGRSETKKGTQKEKEGEETRAVLITGSFPAWKSLFFYRCTDTILFAPLKSEGADRRSDYVRENTVATAPPPCSSKSIYVLADLLEIRPLCDSAFGDIRSKISQKNIVDEVFSWVTSTLGVLNPRVDTILMLSSSQDKILEMECGLLASSFRNPKTIELMNESIGRIADGSSPHSGKVLKLGLKKAFEPKKRPLCATFMCSWIGCPSYNRPISISIPTVGEKSYYCQKCNSTYNL